MSFLEYFPVAELPSCLAKVYKEAPAEYSVASVQPDYDF